MSLTSFHRRRDTFRETLQFMTKHNQQNERKQERKLSWYLKCAEKKEKANHSLGVCLSHHFLFQDNRSLAVSELTQGAVSVQLCPQTLQRGLRAPPPLPPALLLACRPGPSPRGNLPFCLQKHSLQPAGRVSLDNTSEPSHMLANSLLSEPGLKELQREGPPS